MIDSEGGPEEMRSSSESSESENGGVGMSVGYLLFVVYFGVYRCLSKGKAHYVPVSTKSSSES